MPGPAGTTKHSAPSPRGANGTRRCASRSPAATTISTPAQNAKLTNDLGAALANIDQAINRSLDVQTAIGSRMKEIDATEATNIDLGVQFEEGASDLRDVDYAKAISDLTLQRTLLEAAQKSFVQVQGLSLFSLL